MFCQTHGYEVEGEQEAVHRVADCQVADPMTEEEFNAFVDGLHPSGVSSGTDVVAAQVLPAVAVIG